MISSFFVVLELVGRKRKKWEKCYRKHFSSVPFFASTIAALSVLWIMLLLVSFVGDVVSIDGGWMVDIDIVGGGTTSVDVFNGVTASKGLLVITEGNVLLVLFG